jgi:two-component system cell cycle response regulator DivK
MDDKHWLVLIVEDDPDVREVLQVVLKLKYGCDVTVVNDGAAAIECAIREQPDLILMDLVLPVMNGFEATRALVKDPATAQIPVVAISDHSWEEAVYRQAIEAGCRSCINKADLFGDLHKTLHKIMNEYVPGSPR